MRSNIKAWHLWSVIGVVVIVAELIAPPDQLLSEGVDRGLERHPVLVHAAILITAGHLLNMLPTQLDPYAYLPGLAQKGKRALSRRLALSGCRS